MKSVFKKEKGITLVALVVTIIVLLMLAGVSINLVIGDNGIINRSKDAVKKSKDAALNEQLAMNEAEEWMTNQISSVGNGGGISGEDNAEVSIYETDDGKKIPVPDGFTVDESQGKTEDGGIVIKDNVGNEFVWVPVNNPSDMFIQDGVSPGNHAGRLYATTVGNNFNTGLTGQTYTSGMGLREPDIISSIDSTGSDPIGITNSLLQTEFNQMKSSVETYKGFYVGRYETGDLSETTVVVQKDNIDTADQTWYTMYQGAKDLYAADTSVNSNMIWGCQWDQIMRWMSNVPNKTNASNKYILDSRDMGNYTGTRLPTGSNENYKVKNIYDMAGNVSEWTLEGSDSNSRSGRRR